MGRGSKQKGSGFERQVAKQFHEALGIEFVRTPISGGWGRFETKGDIVAAPGMKFDWFIECKKVEGWDLWSALFDDQGPLLNWWTKATKQAKEEKKKPVLVIAQNRQVPLAIYELKYFDRSWVDIRQFHFMDLEGTRLVMTRLGIFLDLYRLNEVRKDAHLVKGRAK